MRSMNKDEAIAYAKNPNNRAIVAIPVLLVLAFIFYVLASFFSYVGGGGDTAGSV